MDVLDWDFWKGALLTLLIVFFGLGVYRANWFMVRDGINTIFPLGLSKLPAGDG